MCVCVSKSCGSPSQPPVTRPFLPSLPYGFYPPPHPHPPPPGYYGPQTTHPYAGIPPTTFVRPEMVSTGNGGGGETIQGSRENGDNTRFQRTVPTYFHGIVLFHLKPHTPLSILVCVMLWVLIQLILTDTDQRLKINLFLK